MKRKAKDSQASVSQQYATKADIADVRHDMELLGSQLAFQIDEVRGDMKEMKEELRGEMRGMKEELRGEITKTKEELRGEMKQLKEELRGEMRGMKEELRGEITSLRTEVKTEIKLFAREIMDHIDAAIEIRKEDLVGASHDEISLMQDTIHQHEERITALEVK